MIHATDRHEPEDAVGDLDHARDRAPASKLGLLVARPLFCGWWETTQRQQTAAAAQAQDLADDRASHANR